MAKSSYSFRQSICSLFLEFVCRCFVTIVFCALFSAGVILVVRFGPQVYASFSDRMLPTSSQLRLELLNVFELGCHKDKVVEGLRLIWIAKLCDSEQLPYTEYQAEHGLETIDAYFDYCRQRAFGKEVRVNFIFDIDSKLKEVVFSERVLE
jgi:hypothetical protein